MFRYIARRLLQIPPTLLLVSIIIFSIIHISPGDPVNLMLGDYATEEDRTLLREQLGLDKPIHQQYIDWMTGVLQGDLGTSLFTGRSVTELMLDRAPYTLILAVFATLVAVVMAIPLGILSAKYHNRAIDHGLLFFAMLGMALPSFVVAIGLIMLFSVTFGILPIAGPGDPFGDPLGSIKFYILPVVALGLLRIAQYIRLVRSSMLDVLRQDYVTVARAKGLAEHRVIVGHALKNSLIPVITVVAISFAATLSGTVVIESIFSIPGVGKLMLDAILRRDFPLIQGITLVLALIFIVMNLVADLLYGLVDPRIRYD